MKSKKKLLYFISPLSASVFFLHFFILKTNIVRAAATCGSALGIFCNPLVGKVDSFADAVIVAIQYLLSVIALISLLFLVFAGIKYLVSFGSEEKMTEAKKAFSSAGSGLIIAVMAYAILSIIYQILNS